VPGNLPSQHGGRCSARLIERADRKFTPGQALIAIDDRDHRAKAAAFAVMPRRGPSRTGTACHGRVILPSFHRAMTASARPLSAATCTPISRRGVYASTK
jgi:hypothetical protein